MVKPRALYCCSICESLFPVCVLHQCSCYSIWHEEEHLVPFVKLFFLFVFCISVHATQFSMEKKTLLLLYGFYSSATYVNLRG